MPRSMPPAVVTMDFADVKMDFLAVVEGRLKIDQPNHASRVRGWIAEYKKGEPGAGSWDGGSAHDTAGWIREGYYVGSDKPAGVISGAPRKRTHWRDEGDDLDLSRALSGDPAPFSSRESGVKPGISIEVKCNFLAATPAKVLEDMGAWLQTLVSGYEAAGHDIELVATYPSTGVFKRRLHVTNWRVQLKRFGQLSDYVAWSPAFAPTGFRHLIFAMWMLYGDRNGLQTDPGLGSSVGSREWGASYDPQTNLLQLDSPASAQHFPGEEMTRKVAAAFTP